MKKIIAAVPLLVVMMAGVFAVSIINTDVRAQGGTLNYVGASSSFSFFNGDLNAWHRDAYSLNNGNQGKGQLQISAVDAAGGQVVLNLNLDEKNILEESATRLYVESTGQGTYSKIDTKCMKVDYNHDKTVNNLDLSLLLSNWGVRHNDLPLLLSKWGCTYVGPTSVNLASVRYDLNKVTGLVNVAGEGDINFRVTGMSLK